MRSAAVNSAALGVPVAAPDGGFWTKLSKGRFADPREMMIEGFSFDDYAQIAPEQMQAFEGAARALCALISTWRETVAQTDQLHDHLMYVLGEARWRLGGRDDYERWLNAHITRRSVKAGNDHGWVLSAQWAKPEDVRALVDWHARECAKFGRWPVNERKAEAGSTLLIHDSAGDSVLWIRWSTGPIEARLWFDLALDATFASPVGNLMRSEFIWRCFPLNYSSFADADHGTSIVKRMTIGAYDGDDASFDGFEPTPEILRLSQQHGLRVFPAQFSFERLSRYWR